MMRKTLVWVCMWEASVSRLDLPLQQVPLVCGVRMGFLLTQALGAPVGLGSFTVAADKAGIPSGPGSPSLTRKSLDPEVPLGHVLSAAIKDRLDRPPQKARPPEALFRGPAANQAQTKYAHAAISGKSFALFVCVVPLSHTLGEGSVGEWSRT